MYSIINMCTDMHFIFMCIHTHTFVCAYGELVKDGLTSSWPTPSENIIELWPSFPEMCIYLLLCDSLPHPTWLLWWEFHIL